MVIDMNVLSDATVSLLVAVLVTLPLTVMLLGWRRGKGSGVWPLVAFLFLVVFLGTWAGGAWMRPHHMGVTTSAGFFWLPFVIIGLLLTLLLAAILPRRRRPKGELAEKEQRVEQTHTLAGGIAAVVLVALAILIALRYFV